MSAYNFKAQFADQIRLGVKVTTIRKRRKTGYVPKVGERIKLYTGMRTKNCLLLKEVTVHSVTPVVVDDQGIAFDGRPLSSNERMRMAENDGFDDYASFLEFFRDTHGLPFIGYLITW